MVYTFKDGTGLARAEIKGVVWDFRMAEAGSAEGRERCIKRFARNAKRNAKFLSSRAQIVRYIAKNVSQSVKTAAVKSRV